MFIPRSTDDPPRRRTPTDKPTSRGGVSALDRRNQGGDRHVQGAQTYPSERWEARCVGVFNLRE